MSGAADETAGWEFSDEDRQAFWAEARQHLDTLEQGLLELERSGGQAGPGLLDELFRAAHSIKGAAGMLGYGSLAHLTHHLESLLDGLRRGSLACSDAVTEALFCAVDALSTLMVVLSEGQDDQSLELGPVIEVLQAALGGPAPIPFGMPPLLPAALQQAVANGCYLYAVALELTGCRTGPEGFTHPVLDKLMALGELMAPEGDPASGRLHGVAYLATPAEPEILAIVSPLPPEGMRLVAAPTSPGPAPAPAAAPAPAPMEAPEPTLPAAVREDRPARRSAAATIRVDVERLDELMDVVGELVIGQTRLARLAQALAARETRDPLLATLDDAVSQLERRIGELQLTVMRVRMVPIERVFGKFHRLMRDLSRSLGKELQLELAGQDTELDRTVIEELEDPLVHLLRNAADHGIETPEARLAAGKPARGTIHLEARREGNHIVVVVRDDGHGIDGARVLAKARELGLASQDVTYDEAEVLAFIFQPGFSTAGRVTDVSGRGVGMDVVGQNIRRIKGTIHVHTQPGAGTTFEIRLPLTLAIAKALIVRADGDAFALPLEAVHESIRVAAPEVHTIGRRPTIRLRDRIVPLLYLAELFERPTDRGRESFPVVIVGSAGRQVGLVVDRLDGEQDVVIKTLGAYLGDVPGTAGATILGDGRVALIVDVTAVLDGVRQEELETYACRP